MPKQKLCVGDHVRVVQSGGSLGPTLYVLDWLGEGPYKSRCVIRESGNPLAGGQEFDTSLIQKVDPDKPVKTTLAAKKKAALAALNSL